MYSIQSVHIVNFRNVEETTLHFGKNKTVFVGKNGSGKTIILKAIEKLLNSKKIKEKDFKNKQKPLLIEAVITHRERNYTVKLEAELQDGEVIVHANLNHPDIQALIDKINVIYIPSDRKITNENKENGYAKLIDLILKRKEDNTDNIVETAKRKLDSLNSKTGRKKTTLLMSLLKLYMYSVENHKSDEFTIFIIDQPENFLHPHATKVIDQTIQRIGESRNTQVFYSTHSPDLVSNFKKGKYEISDIVFVSNDGHSSKAKKIENQYGRYNKIMISLIFKNAGIFFSDGVILVEGETERISIPNIYENTDWSKYCGKWCDNLSEEQRENYFNLSYKNISIIDVGGKGALYEWFAFASEIFGKEHVIALIDKDNNYHIDRDLIKKTIQNVYKIPKVYESEFADYNWMVLDGEFESYYKIEVIRDFLRDTITRRAKRFGDKFDQNKYNLSLSNLERKLKRLEKAKKISTVYESLFNSYFRKYSKPTIAFNLSTWLCESNGYKPELLELFSDMIRKLNKS